MACKWSNICQYYVNSMVISCSTYQKEEKESTLGKYLIYAVLLQCPICCNLRVFLPLLFTFNFIGAAWSIDILVPLFVSGF